MMNKKTVALILACLLVAITGVSANLLGYFGSVTQNVDVEQSVVLNGDTEVSLSSVGSGVSISGLYSLDNNANVPIDVSLETTEVEGVTTSPTNTIRTLVLDNKDSSWQRVEDDRIATLMFDNKGLTFDYALDAEGLESDTQYSLIYYVDQTDRFDNWGAVQAVLGVGTTDENGNLKMSGSLDLGMNLPHPDDANVDEYDYCVSDGYEHCHGAKIWLIPSSDYNDAENKMSAWNQDRYLFETDMVEYERAEAESMDSMEVPAQGSVDFYLKNVFDASFEGEATLTTTVVPQ